MIFDQKVKEQIAHVVKDSRLNFYSMDDKIKCVQTGKETEYIVHTQNLNENERYHLILKDRYDNHKHLVDFVVKNNESFVKEMDCLLLEIPFTFDNYSKGDILDIIVLSENKKECYSCMISPKPLEAEFEDDAKIILEKLVDGGLMYAVYFLGFKKNEKIELVSTCGDSVSQNFKTVNEFGNGFMMMIPQSLFNNKKGDAILNINRGSESKKIEYLWG